MGEYADLSIEGFCCMWCGRCFEREHGYPVLCRECFAEQRRMKVPQRDRLLKATEAELGEGKLERE